MEPRDLGHQGAILRRAKLKGIGTCNLLPGGACNLQRCVRNVPAQDLFRLFKTDGHVHDGVALCFLRQPQSIRSALPLTADIFSALAHVRFVPKADINLFDHLVSATD